MRIDAGTIDWYNDYSKPNDQPLILLGFFGLRGSPSLSATPIATGHRHDIGSRPSRFFFGASRRISAARSGRYCGVGAGAGGEAGASVGAAGGAALAVSVGFVSSG